MNKKEELTKMVRSLNKAISSPDIRSADLLRISQQVDLLVNDIMRDMHSSENNSKDKRERMGGLK